MIAIIHLLFWIAWIWLAIGSCWSSVHKFIGRFVCLIVPMLSFNHWASCLAETRKGTRAILLVAYVLFLFPFGGIANLWPCHACDYFGDLFPPHSVYSIELSLVSLASIFIGVFLVEIDEILLHHPNPISHRVGIVLGASILLAWIFAVVSAVFRLSSVWIDLAVITLELLLLVSIAMILNRDLKTELKAKLALYAVIRIVGLVSQLTLVAFVFVNEGFTKSHESTEQREFLLAGISAAGGFFAIGAWIVIDIGVACYSKRSSTTDYESKQISTT